MRSALNLAPSSLDYLAVVRRNQAELRGLIADYDAAGDLRGVRHCRRLLAQWEQVERNVIAGRGEG